MTGNGGSDLPNDLLGAIYNRCSTSYDRTRFAAVCKSWRTAASLQPKPPALPLLLPSTGNSCLDQMAHAYSSEDDRVLRSWLQWFPCGKQIVGSHDGGWVAATTGSHIEIMNLFTRGWRVPVKGHIRGRILIKKVVFSEEPISERCILAAMTTNSTVALYRFGCPAAGWTTRRCNTDFVDIAFCNGELYGLSCYDDELYEYGLHKITIGISEHDAKVTILYDKLTIQWPEMFKPTYIFQLRGKLAAAVKVRRVGGSKVRCFKVFELVASGDTTQRCKYAWAEVTSLGDHALFLGPGCCKAVHISAMGRRGEVQGNRIYYSMQNHNLPDGMDPECLDAFDLGSCDVYSYENQEAHHMERIVSRGYHYSRDKRDCSSTRNNCTWIFPPRF